MNFFAWCRNEWERAIALFSVIGGLLAFLLGWIGLSDKGLVTQQVPYLVSGALFGIFLLAVGATMWLSADMHDEWAKLDRLEEMVARAISPPSQASTSEHAESAPTSMAARRDHSRLHPSRAPEEVRG